MEDKKTKNKKSVTYLLSEGEYPVTLTASTEIALKINDKDVIFQREEDKIVLYYSGMETRALEHNCTICETKFTIKIMNGKLVFGTVPQCKFEILAIR